MCATWTNSLAWKDMRRNLREMQDDVRGTNYREKLQKPSTLTLARTMDPLAQISEPRRPLNSGPDRQKYMLWPWIEHGTVRSSVWRSPNWAIKALHGILRGRTALLMSIRCEITFINIIFILVRCNNTLQTISLKLKYYSNITHTSHIYLQNIFTFTYLKYYKWCEIVRSQRLLVVVTIRKIAGKYHIHNKTCPV